jgi:uncharacterized protein YndB with AHSA1/START domain
MIMTDTMQAAAPITRPTADSIRLERLLDAPMETVWRYLTEADLRREWFMGGTDATPGSAFELVTDHDNLSSDDVPYPEAHECYRGMVWKEKVLRFEPPSLLETTFQGGKNGSVTYELFEQGPLTRLILTHRGIVSGTGAHDFGGGWHSHLAVLQEKLAGRTVRDFWALYAGSRDEIGKALG